MAGVSVMMQILFFPLCPVPSNSPFLFLHLFLFVCPPYLGPPLDFDVQFCKQLCVVAFLFVLVFRFLHPHLFTFFGGLEEGGGVISINIPIIFFERFFFLRAGLGGGLTK